MNFRDGEFSELLSDSFLDTGRRSPILLFDAYTGDPFPNNVIPPSQIHAGAKNVLDQFVPRAQFREADPLRETARSAVDDAIDSNLFFGRADHHFSDSDRFFGRLAWDETGGRAGDINPNTPFFVDGRTVNLAASWAHTFNQNAINDLRFGSTGVGLDATNPRTNDESFDMDALGVGQIRVAGDGNRPLKPLEVGLPSFSGLPFRLRDRGPLIESSGSLQIADHVSIMRGRHNLKLGGEYQHVSLDVGGSNFPRGRFSFGSNESGWGFRVLPAGPAERNNDLGRLTVFTSTSKPIWCLCPR